MSGVDERLDLIDAVIYGDAFDCAVTLEEAWRYSRARGTPEDLRARFGEPVLRQVIAVREGLCFLAGREALGERRSARRERARQLRLRARKVATWLQHAPFVRGILLTGSAAAEDAGERADVDLLLIVGTGRVACTFVMLAGLSRLLSRSILCPNYYLSEAHLVLARRDQYSARELAQAEILAGNAHDLLSANGWVTRLLPNAAPRGAAVSPLPGGPLLQRLFELPLRGRIGDRIERWAHRLAQARLAVHHGAFGRPVPQEVRDRFDAGIELRFHGAPLVDACLERYERRRAEVGACIEQLTAPAAVRR